MTRSSEDHRTTNFQRRLPALDTISPRDRDILDPVMRPKPPSPLGGGGHWPRQRAKPSRTKCPAPRCARTICDVSSPSLTVPTKILIESDSVAEKIPGDRPASCSPSTTKDGINEPAPYISYSSHRLAELRLHRCRRSDRGGASTSRASLCHRFGRLEIHGRADSRQSCF